MSKIVEKIIVGSSILFDLFKWPILILIIVVLFNQFVFSVFIVDGISMEPNLMDKSLVAYSKISYKNDDPNRGDVVVVRYPGDPEKKRYVKRVIGLPGEKIEIKDGKIYLNGEPLKEEYLPFGTATEPNQIVNLPDNKYFLLGDNRVASNDSRIFGSVEKRFLVGKATFLMYPRLKNVKPATY